MNRFNYQIGKQLKHKVKASDRLSFFRYPVNELQEYLSRPFYNDILQSLITQEKGNPSDRVVSDVSEGVVNFTNQAALANYITVNIQLQHGWVIGSDIEPHIHWFQNQNQTPNLLLQYRWQLNGAEKVNDWVNLKVDKLIFPYPSTGTPTINQIATFGKVTPPDEVNVSEIIQFRVIRDTANASTLFGGADTYTGNVSLVNFDLHIKVDAFGSRKVYEK